MTSSNNIHLIEPDNDKIIGKDSRNYLHPDDFSSFNESYHIGYYPDKYWIGFSPKDNSLEEKIRKKNGGSTCGYKIHIAIRKDDIGEYKKHLQKVIEILNNYGFVYKINSRLDKEKSGARAFTIYLPHKFHAHWFEALKEVDKYLVKELVHQKMPKEYSSDDTAKMVSGFKYIRYRNDRGPNGRYTRYTFNDTCEGSLKNPFRPSIASLLHEIYDHDIELYKRIAIQMKNNTVYSAFLVQLRHHNKTNFMNLVERLAYNAELHSMVTDLCRHDLTHERNNLFELAEKLVKNPGHFNAISTVLSDKTACPAYHKSTHALDAFKKTNPGKNIEREAKKIVNTIKAITIKALHTKLFENKPFDKHAAQQKISTEINARLGENEDLTVDKSLGGVLKATLLNIFHATPIIGWAAGAYKYSQTGSFWHSYTKKTKPHKQVEQALTTAISSNNILNVK